MDAAKRRSKPPPSPKPEEYTYPLHGGRVVGSILRDCGVKYVFGIPAAFVWALETGFHEHDITRVHMRSHQGAAYAADAYARCTRSPGICFGSAGVGMTDSVSGIHQAWLARSPVIGLFGMHEWDQSRRGVLQEAYPSQICRTMTKWSVDLDDKHLVPLYLRWALRDCMIYPPGPIVLGLTMRALGAIRDEESLIGDIPHALMAPPSPSEGDPTAVERAVRLLVNAERPVAVAGDGVYWSDAADELRELAELLNMPVNMMRMARGAVPEEHPLALGGAYREDFWLEADVLLILGLEPGSEWSGQPPAWPTEAKRIVVQESATDGGASLPSDEFIVGSPKLVLRQMLSCIRDRRYLPRQRANWLRHLHRCRCSHDEARAEDETEYEGHSPIHPWVLAREIAGFLDPNATVILDSFLVSPYLADKIKATFLGQLLDSGGAISFGHGIGMGIGAQLARPGKQVFVLTSDTSIGMGGGDVETALRYKLPIVYLVCTTGSLASGVDCYFRGQAYPWDYLPNIRYDQIYQVIGAHGEYVTAPDGIRPALYRAFNSGKAAVVNVVVDNRVVHPWLESLPFREGVIAHQLDVGRIPEPYKSYLLLGRTSEVEAALDRAGVPRSKTRKRAMSHSQGNRIG